MTIDREFLEIMDKVSAWFEEEGREREREESVHAVDMPCHLTGFMSELHLWLYSRNPSLKKKLADEFKAKGFVVQKPKEDENRLVVKLRPEISAVPEPCALSGPLRVCEAWARAKIDGRRSSLAEAVEAVVGDVKTRIQSGPGPWSDEKYETSGLFCLHWIPARNACPGRCGRFGYPGCTGRRCPGHPAMVRVVPDAGPRTSTHLLDLLEEMARHDEGFVVRRYKHSLVMEPKTFCTFSVDHPA